MAVCQNLVPLVNIKIAGKWMFIPLKMVLIGIDPYPYGISILSMLVIDVIIFSWIVDRSMTFRNAPGQTTGGASAQRCSRQGWCEGDHDMLKKVDMGMDQYLLRNTIFRGMNIHLPAILMFTRGTRFWHTTIYHLEIMEKSWENDGTSTATLW